MPAPLMVMNGAVSILVIVLIYPLPALLIVISTIFPSTITGINTGTAKFETFA